jgi:hypothetical protein
MKARKGPNAMKGEEHGLSVFFRLGDEVFREPAFSARSGHFQPCWRRIRAKIGLILFALGGDMVNL